MKKLIAIMIMMLAVVMVGCNNKPKNRIEEKFERYVSANFVEPSDYKGIASIVCTDSMAVLETISKFSAFIDSLGKMRRECLETINKSLPKCSYTFKTAHAAEYASVLMKDLSYTLSTPNRNNKLFEKRQELVAVSDSTCTLNKYYTIKVKIKGYIEAQTYYALDCALIDTVLISSSPIKISDLPHPLSGTLALIDEYRECVDADLEMTKQLNEIKNEILLELQGK